MYELKVCRDFESGKITKENLDKCSTCEISCIVNDGLSKSSKEQLKFKSGEQIVDDDISEQMKNHNNQ